MHWNNQVRNDMRTLGVDIEMVEDIIAWSCFVDKAKNQLGFKWLQQ